MIATALIIMLPSFLWGPSQGDSSKFNLIWTAGMAQPELYPRWMSGSFDGLGSPTFYFYPPLFFLVSGKLHALGLSVETALNVAAFLALAASGFAMAAWLRERAASPWWALLYMLLPYHLADLFNRGALAEFAAYIWPPLIALGIQRLPERKGAILLCLSTAALVLTHLPVAMLTLTFLAAPLAIIRTIEDRRALPWAAVAVALGIALSAVYLVPALGLLNYTNAQIFTGPYYQPSRWSLFSAPWPGDQVREGVRIMLAFALAGLAWSVTGSRVWRWLTLALAAGAVGIIPFWIIPPLDRVQFPWRLLGLAEFSAVTALAISPSRRPIPIAMSVALAVPFIGTNLADAAVRLYFASPAARAETLRQMPDGAEYAPHGFPARRISEGIALVDTTPYAHLPSADGPIIVTRAGEIVLRRFYFPAWRIVGPHGVIQTYPTKDGLIAFKAQPGTYRLQRITLPLEQVAMGASLIALLCLFGMALLARQPRTTTSDIFRIRVGSRQS